MKCTCLKQVLRRGEGCLLKTHTHTQGAVNNIYYNSPNTNTRGIRKCTDTFQVVDMHVQMYTVEMMLIIYKIKIHILFSGPLLNTEGHCFTKDEIRGERDGYSYYVQFMFGLCCHKCVCRKCFSLGDLFNSILYLN